MPHLIIEYSANLEKRMDLDGLLDRLYETATTTGMFPLGGIRIRAYRADAYRIADCHVDNAFVHVTAIVGSGRTLECREEVSRSLFDAICETLGPLQAEGLVGTLTVTLSESTNASKSAATNTVKDDDIEIGGGTLLGVTPTSKGNAFLNNQLESERAFSGSGDSSQSNSLNGQITVMVVDILPNSNMLVRGEKIIGLNQGSEYLRISGIVRPQDVSANNEIESTKLANARIYYGGGGAIAEANTKGWLSRFFDSPVFPF